MVQGKRNYHREETMRLALNMVERVAVLAIDHGIDDVGAWKSVARLGSVCHRASADPKEATEERAVIAKIGFGYGIGASSAEQNTQGKGKGYENTSAD